jgi:polyisoprenoid-binding protein YceI
MRCLLSPTLFALMVASAAFGASAQTVIPAQSEISFTTRQMGVPVDGRFRRFEAQVAFDPRKPEAARIGFTIDLASTRIGTAETEAELAKPEWFHIAAFPQASFQSTGVRPLGGGRFEVTGRLGIKGSTREVMVPVALAQTGASGTATGSFSLKRLEFRIGEGDWKDTSIVADEVVVRFRLALSGLPAP